MRTLLLQCRFGRLARRVLGFVLWLILLAAVVIGIWQGSDSENGSRAAGALGSAREHSTLTAILLLAVAQVLANLVPNLLSAHLWELKALHDRLSDDRIRNHDVSRVVLFALQATAACSIDKPAHGLRMRWALFRWGRELQRNWISIREQIASRRDLHAFGEESTRLLVQGRKTSVGHSEALALLALTGVPANDPLHSLLVRQIVRIYPTILRDELKVQASSGGRGWIATEIQLWRSLFIQLDRVERLVVEMRGVRFSIPSDNNEHPEARYHFKFRRIRRLIGRESEQKRLHAFLEHTASFRWWIVTGPGGVGKSRLALEFCMEANDLGWAAGFVDDTSHADWFTWQPTQPTLLVVDYALEKGVDAWRDTLARLAERGPRLDHPVRVLFLDRPASEELWHSCFSTSDRSTAATFHGAFRKDESGSAKVAILELGGLDRDGLWAVFEAIFRDLSLAGKSPRRALTSFSREYVLDAYERTDPLGRPLFTQMAAEKLAIDGVIAALDLTALTNWVVDRLLEHWRSVGVDDAHVRLLALATMTRGLDLRTDISKRGELPGGVLPDLPDYNSCTHMAAVSADFDPRAPFLPALEPDPLGEAFVIRCLRGQGWSGNQSRRSQFSGMLPRAAERLHADEMIEFLRRVSGDFPNDLVLFHSITQLDLRGTSPPNLEALRALTGLTTLQLSSTSVADLEPLRALTSLNALDLSLTPVADLEPLRALTSLTELGLQGTPVTDLEPLRALTSLTTLDLSLTAVADLEPLRTLTSLTTLELWRTPVADLEPLRALTSLNTLDLSSTSVADLEPLSALASLSTLNLRGTDVGDLEPLSALASLSTLDLRGTDVGDLKPLHTLTSLNKLDLSITSVTDLEPLRALTSLTELDLAGTSVTDLEPLRALTSLTTLNLSFTPVADLEPLRALTSLTELRLRATSVADLEPLRALTSLTELDLEGTSVTDLEPLRALTSLTMLGLSLTPVADLWPVAVLKHLSFLTLSCVDRPHLDVLRLLPSLKVLVLKTPLLSADVLRAELPGINIEVREASAPNPHRPGPT